MRYDVGRFRRPMRRSTEGQLMSLISLGDGSTLTLDFTTGVLDSRLTFTRDTNATFINSSGLVQYADANMMRNSSWSDSNPVPQSWSGAGNTPTIPATGSRTFTVTTAANSYVAEGGAGATGSQGVVYTAAVEVTAVSGSPTYNNTILATASPTGVSWYRNGTPVNGTDAVQTGVIAYVFTSGSGSFVRIGLGASGGTVTNQSITMTKPRLMPGVRVDSPYFPSASATNQYQAPRFDHDPTTLAPKGLLIEGAAVNLCLRSEDFGNASWQVDNSGATNPVVSTVSQTAPNGASSVNRVTLNKTGGTFSRLYQAITGTAGQTYTLSVWMKANTANGGAATQNVGLRIGGSTGINCVVTTTWQRFTHPAFAITGTDANFQLLLWDNVPANDETADVLVWGAQVELGSGASSYIPTGASQGSRAADNCELLDLTTMGFNANTGTIYTDVGTRLSTGSQRNYTFLPASGSNNQIFEGSGVAFNVYTSGSFVAQIGSSGLSASKIAAAYATGDYAVSVNGGAVATDSAGAVPTSLTKLTIGGSIVNATAYANGCIRVFKYWPTRLPNAQLQSLTT